MLPLGGASDASDASDACDNGFPSSGAAQHSHNFTIIQVAQWSQTQKYLFNKNNTGDLKQNIIIVKNRKIAKNSQNWHKLSNR